jgi:hypothetical protein
MKTPLELSFASVLISAFLSLSGAARATDLTLPVGGRVQIEFVSSESRAQNTLAVVNPDVATQQSDCSLEAASGLPGLDLLTDKASAPGCTVQVVSSVGTSNQSFAAGTSLEFRLCSSYPGQECKYIWSSNPAKNPDYFDHVRTKELDERSFELSWENLPGGGDKDFDDLTVRVRIEPSPQGPTSFVRLLLSHEESGEAAGIISCTAANSASVITDFSATKNEENNLFLPERLAQATTVGNALCALQDNVEGLNSEEVLDIGQLMQKLGTPCIALGITPGPDQPEQLTNLGCTSSLEGIPLLLSTALTGASQLHFSLLTDFAKEAIKIIAAAIAGVAAEEGFKKATEKPPEQPPKTTPTKPRGPIIVPCPDTGCS